MQVEIVNASKGRVLRWILLKEDRVCSHKGNWIGLD
jgi:hypothetical protein